MPGPGGGILRSARRALDATRQLSQSALLHAPVALPAVTRVWSVWGGDVRRYALVHPDRSFMYATVPKAANSTVRRLLWRLLGVEVSGPMLERVLHSGPGPYLSLPDLSFFERKRVLTGSETFRFSFVRNPYDRLLSAYRQKFLNPAPHENWRTYAKLIGWTAPQPPSFAEFLGRILRQSDTEMNVHWKPQYRCLVFDAVPFDFIGKVETFDVDMRWVLHRVGAPASAYAPDLWANHVPLTVPREGSFNQSLAEQVFHRYRRDFELFGYDESSYPR